VNIDKGANHIVIIIAVSMKKLFGFWLPGMVYRPGKTLSSASRRLGLLCYW